jgi:hypothetical protein
MTHRPTTGVQADLARRLRDLFLATDEGRGQIALFAAIPDAVPDVWADIYWIPERLFALTSPVTHVSVADFAWTLDVPFGRDGDRLFALTARDVLAAPGTWLAHHARIEAADTSYPIALYRYRGRTVVLDGYHRLARATMLGIPTLPSRMVEEADLPGIMIQDGFLGELNRLRNVTPHLLALLRSVARTLS